MVIDPPSPEYDRLLAAYVAYARSLGVDLSVGRRLHRLFREAGLADIHVDATIEAHPVGHSRRLIFCDSINNVRAQLIEGEFMNEANLERNLSALERQLADPGVLATSPIYFALRGRVPDKGAVTSEAISRS